MCSPTERVEVEKLALAAIRTDEAIVVPPSLKSTVPEGVPTPPAVTWATVAVNVTVCPNAEGFKFEETVVVVFALFTVLGIVAFFPSKAAGN